MGGYLRRARELLASAAEPPPGVRAFVNFAEVCVHVIQGDWERADAVLHGEIGELRRAGNWRQELFALVMDGGAEYWRGGDAVEPLARMVELASRVDNAQYSCWARVIRGTFLVRAGDLDGAARLLAEAEVHQARAHDAVAGAYLHGCAALCALRRGDLRGARSRADATLEALSSCRTVGWGQLPPVFDMVEVYVTLWSGAGHTAGEADLRGRLEQSLAWARRVAIMFPIARSRAFLWHGRYAALRGHAALAAPCFRRALASARRHRTPFDEALARKALAEAGEASGDPRGADEHRRAARAIFERLGASWYLTEP
jgi:hypothetical protein